MTLHPIGAFPNVHGNKKSLDGQSTVGGLILSSVFFGDGDKLCESLRVGNGKFSHHFAIDGDTRLGQAADEFAVRNAVETSRRVDTGNPQATEFAFFDASVAVCVLTGLQDRFVGFFELFAPRAAITFGKLEDFFMASVRCDAGFHSRQVNLLRSQVSGLSSP